MISSTSTKFPASPDQDSLFTIQMNIPEDTSFVPSSYSPKRCKKCKSFLLQEENICPICNPMALVNMRDTTHFRFFQIEEHKINIHKDSILFFLFDLDCDIVELLAVANYIVLDLTKDKYYSTLKVCFGFLGSSCQLYEKTESGMMHFFPLSTFEDIVNHAKAIIDYTNSIFTAINIAKRSLIPETDKTQQLKHLCQILENQTYKSTYVSDAFYFFKGEIPKDLTLNIGVRFHMYNYTNEPSQNNMTCALKLKSTYYVTSNSGPELFAELKKHITKHSVNTCQMSIIASQGACFKDVYGPVSHVSVYGNTSNIELNFYSKAIPVYATLKSQKDGYNKAEAFSVQVLASVIPGTIFVINEVWLKAKDPADWYSSISSMFFKGIYFHRLCIDSLSKNFAKNVLPWMIPAHSVKFPRELQEFRSKLNVYECFIMNLFSQKSIIDDPFLMYILISMYYGQKTFLENFIWSIDSQNLTLNHIVLPPLIFVCQDINGSDINLHHDSLSSMTIVRTSPEFFNRLKSMLQETQKKLNTLPRK